MSRAIDLTGQRFGRLMVLYKKGQNKYKQNVWHCRCDCGNEKDVTTGDLNGGKVKSCGCYRKDCMRQIAHSRRKYNIKAGDRIGSLTILEEIEMGKYKCLCDCGREFVTTGKILSVGDATTCGCGINRINHTFINEEGNRYGKLTVIELVGMDNNHRSLWKCQCDCGNFKITTGHALRIGQAQSCGCLKSKGEQKIQTVLLTQNISFETQKSFNDLRSDKNRLLFFDFYLPEYNILIEYQGQQHSQVIEHFGGVKGFQERQQRDNLKRAYCKKNNIKLVEIPYTDYDKINWEYLKEKCNL